MAASSPDVDSIARNSFSLLLRAIEKVGQNTVAAGCGVDPATVSNDKAKYWERFCREAALAGLKLVPSANICYPPEHMDHLQYFAQIGMARIGDVPTLEFDE